MGRARASPRATRDHPDGRAPGSVPVNVPGMLNVAGKPDQDPRSPAAALSRPGLEAALERACGVALAAGASASLPEPVPADELCQTAGTLLRLPPGG